LAPGVADTYTLASVEAVVLVLWIVAALEHALVDADQSGLCVANAALASWSPGGVKHVSFPLDSHGSAITLADDGKELLAVAKVERDAKDRPSTKPLPDAGCAVLGGYNVHARSSSTGLGLAGAVSTPLRLFSLCLCCLYCL